MIPSITQIGAAMENIFVMEDWHNMGPNYDQTLMTWYANFERAWPQLKNNYDERFYRMWKYYLLSSAGGFRSRTLQLWQIVMTRLGTTQPNCRIS
jgi:cyclopropane-fatty-acyl-phospholipid synthase